MIVAVPPAFSIESLADAEKAEVVILQSYLPQALTDEEVSAILPVLKSPTILPLAQPGWSSLHSVIDEDKFWEVIDALKAAGAEGILVAPIDKIVR